MNIPRMSYPQYRKARRLTHECCNYCNGNCLLLDDGEECVCVQSISYSLLCRWFKVMAVSSVSHCAVSWGEVSTSGSTQARLWPSLVGSSCFAGVAGDVVFLTEKRPHAAHLQNTLASVHRCNFVLAHQLLSEFLVVQSVGGLRAPVLALVVAVNSFLTQHLRDLLGVLAPATQEQRTVAVVGNDFRRVLVNGL